MKKKTRTTIFSVVLAGLIIYLAYTAFSNSVSSYYDVSELTARASILNGTKVNVNGTVVPGSVSWYPEKILLTFSITDNVNTVNVVYNDAIPNNLRDDNPVTVTGIYYENNTLVAHNILTKCPSKYEATITDESAT